MPQLKQFFLYGLLIAAIIVIFNCAGYLTITFVFGAPPNSSGEAVSSMPLKGVVVSYATATPALLASAADASLETQASALPTPLPLLPTVTPTPPTASLPATSTPTPLPLAATAVPPDTQTQRAATAAPGELGVISHQSYVDSLGWYHIVGEVKNNSNVTMEYVEVMAKLYDARQEVIGTKLTFTAPDIIFPGGTAPFDIIALRQSQWREIDSYALQVKGDVSLDAAQQNLVLLSQDSYIQDGLMVVSGEIQNTGQKPALAKLVVTLYDAQRQVVNTGWGYANAGIIAADGVSEFEIKIDHQTDPDNYHYQIQIEEEAIDRDSK